MKLGRCTCGVKLPVDKYHHYDITGWCQDFKHDQCNGGLSAATGYHWWCACKCHEDHPDPFKYNADAAQALNTWMNARAK